MEFQLLEASGPYRRPPSDGLSNIVTVSGEFQSDLKVTSFKWRPDAHAANLLVAEA